MIPFPIKTRAIIVVFVLCMSPCPAQEAPKVSLRFLSFPKAIDPVKVELQISEGKTIEIEAPGNEFSPPVDVVSPGVWSVGETVKGPDGKPVFKEYGRTNAVASPQQMLLLVRKGKENADGFELVALDGRVDGFGGGKFLFMNAAKVDIAGVVGSERFVVKPGKHSIVKPKGGGNDDKKLVHAALYFRADGQGKPFFSSTWPLSDAARCLIFFYHDPDTKRLRLHSIRDFIQ
jgi:hypothetical protein